MWYAENVVPLEEKLKEAVLFIHSCEEDLRQKSKKIEELEKKQAFILDRRI